MLLGRLVHFVAPDGYEGAHGQCRPAIVVQDWRETDGSVNLVVFRDGTNDRPDGAVCEWQTSIRRSDRHEFGTWHEANDCPYN